MEEDEGIGGQGVTDAAEAPSGDRGGEEQPAAEEPVVVAGPGYDDADVAALGSLYAFANGGVATGDRLDEITARTRALEERVPLQMRLVAADPEQLAAWHASRKV